MNNKKENELIELHPVTALYLRSLVKFYDAKDAADMVDYLVRRECDWLEDELPKGVYRKYGFSRDARLPLWLAQSEAMAK